jgi:hypothetical protein
VREKQEYSFTILLFPLPRSPTSTLFMLLLPALVLRTILTLIRSPLAPTVSLRSPPPRIPGLFSFSRLRLNQLGYRLKQLATLRHLNKPEVAQPSLPALGLEG